MILVCTCSWAIMLVFSFFQLMFQLKKYKWNFLGACYDQLNKFRHVKVSKKVDIWTSHIQLFTHLILFCSHWAWLYRMTRVEGCRWEEGILPDELVHAVVACEGNLTWCLSILLLGGPVFPSNETRWPK
jgi:hypothetical protein